MAISTLFDFIKTLDPRIQKASVIKDMDAIISEMGSYVLPMVKSMADTSTSAPLNSEWFQVFESNIQTGLKTPKRSTNCWLDLYSALLNVQANATQLRTSIEARLQEDTLRDGITAVASNMIRMVAAMSFVCSYTSEACDYLIAQESVHLGDSDDTPPAQARYIRSNIEKYVTILKDISIDPKEFAKRFDVIPDVYISEKNRANLSSLYAAKDIDPFANLNLASGWSGGIIYNMRLMWESYHAERFHAMKERKAILELRLLHLNNQRAGSSNPRLQKEIEGLQSRINKYDRKIRDVEASIY